jgi:4-methyl-5(b-hydroxyethyl)-thiazole monophosphate biosynthesis
MGKALVPLADGFEEIEAMCVIDVLRRGGVETVVSSIHDRREVIGAHGVKVVADALFSDVGGDAYDVIVLPGGGEGTDNLKSCAGLLERLRRQRDEERFLAAVCAAPTVLVEAGVLGNEHITCYPTCQKELDRPWCEASVVADGLVITGQAPGSALLFALVVLQQVFGEALSKKVARAMVTDVIG